MLTACVDRPGAAEQETGGTLIVSTPAEPTSLMPLFADRSNTRQVSDLVFERLAELGPEMNTMGDGGFTPSLADSWTWSADSLQIEFAISPAALWHDGARVTAHDVAFTYTVAKDPRTGAYMRQPLARIDSVTASDSLTAVVWFSERYPEQFFDAVEHVHIIPSHLLADIPPAGLRSAPFGRAPIGSGPFRFSRWDAGQVVEVVANDDYHRGRPLLDRVAWTIVPDGTAAAARLFSGEADLYEGILPEQVRQVEADPSLRLYTADGLAYAFIGFNFVTPSGEPHPMMRNRELRRAISRALDREAMLRNVWDTLAVVPRGPFARALPDVDTTFATLEFNRVAAARTLDSLGWTGRDSDGFRTRAGRRLSFRLLVPSSSPPRVRMAVLAQSQLREMGIHANVETLEFNAFISRVQAGDFDAYTGAWQLDGSPSGLRQTWFGNATDEMGGGNFQGYSNPLFEAYADSALWSWSPEARRAYLRTAYEIIVQDAAAVWLYEPLSIIGVHSRFRVPGLRSSGWWRDVSRWYVPADKQLPRDRMQARQ